MLFSILCDEDYKIFHPVKATHPTVSDLAGLGVGSECKQAAW
jgi:hypothetical protein